MSAEPVLRRSLLLASLLGLAGTAALFVSAQMDDPDYWWHLRAGDWTLAHGAVPDLETFSARHVNERWVAYSWLYDVLLSVLHKAFGLQGPVILAVALALAITGTLCGILRRLSGSPAVAVALTGTAVVAMARMFYGRSTMLTMLFALLEIRLLYEALVFRRARALFLVPLVIALWANVHVQFTYGLFLFGCFAAQALYERQPRKPWIVAGLGCLAATLANPYGFRIYEPFFQYLAQSSTIYGLIRELQASGFRTFDGWAMLAIVLSVAYVVGRKGVQRPFILLSFAVAVVVGFRSARDIWFIAATGLPIVAMAFARREEATEARAHPALVALGTAVFLAIGVLRLDLSQAGLERTVEKLYPAKAAEWIAANREPGAILNHYNWGGYLLWKLPEFQVSMDGRTYVYASDFIEHSARMWNAAPGCADDPELLAADLVVGDREHPLVVLLERDPRFERAYGDTVAEVFVRKNP